MPAPAERRTAMSMPPLSTGCVPTTCRFCALKEPAPGSAAPDGRRLGRVFLHAQEAAQPREVEGEQDSERYEGNPEQQRILLAPDPPGHQLPDGEAEAEHDRRGDQEAVERDQGHVRLQWVTSAP